MRRKVAMVVNHLGGGGAEKTVQTLTNHWLASGICDEVVLVCLESAKIAYDFDSRAQVLILPFARFCGGFGKILVLPLQAWALTQLLKREKPTHCVSFLVRANLTHCLTSLFGNRLPICLAEQCSTIEFYAEKTVRSTLMRNLVAFFYPTADLIIAVSRGVASDLKKIGVSEGKIRVVHNPVEVEAPRNTTSKRQPGGLEVITIGRLEPVKDQATLIKAFSLVHKSLPGAKLTLVGTGTLQDELRKLTNTLGLEGIVCFAGWHDRPAELLAKSDLFVLSSLSEGFGIVLVEALACGVPVVSTRCPGGVEEILDGGRFGLFVSVGDAGQMADAIIKVLTDAQLRDSLAESGYLRAGDFGVELLAPLFFRVMDNGFLTDSGET